MTMYSVVWAIDVEADSPKEAAQQCREMQLDPASTATVFDVADCRGMGVYIVDLEDVT